MIRATLFLFLLVSVTSLTRAEQKAPQFDVVMSPPEKVGDRWRIATSGTSKWKAVHTNDGDAQANHTTQSIELEGVLTVLEVSKKSTMSKFSLKVERCVASVDSGAQHICNKGDVIVVSTADAGKLQMTLNDKPVSEINGDAEGLLGIVLSIGSPESLTADESFPSNGKRSVGEKWKKDAKAGSVSWAKVGATVREEDISGEASLLEHSPYKGVPCLTIRTTEESKNVILKDDPASDSKSEPGSARSIAKLIVPDDVPWRFSVTEYEVEVVYRFKSRTLGDRFRSELTVSRTLKCLRERVAADAK